MNYVITGVQITSIIVMGLATLSFSFLFPHRINIGKIYSRSRKYLILGTFLSALHYAIQLHLQVNYTHIEDIRTLLNLTIGMPCCFLFNISYLNLIRRGNVRRWELAVFYICFAQELLMLGYYFLQGEENFSIDALLPIMAALFAITIFFYFYRIVREYLIIKSAYQRNEADPTLVHLIHWTKWMTFIMIVVAFGYPLMAFHTNLNLRGLYGILSVATAYFYISSFIGFGVYMQNRKMTIAPYSADTAAAALPAESPTILDQQDTTTGKANATIAATMVQTDSEEDDVPREASATEVPLATPTLPLNEWQEKKRENVEIIVSNFLKTDFYLQPGVKLKDVADQMGISVALLKTWLRTTPYVKFTNWLLAIRIEHAKELMLTNPDFSSDEIALQCGFCDRQYFQTQFKKRIGISPSDWLKVQKPR